MVSNGLCDPISFATIIYYHGGLAEVIKSGWPFGPIEKPGKYHQSFGLDNILCLEIKIEMVLRLAICCHPEWLDGKREGDHEMKTILSYWAWALRARDQFPYCAPRNSLERRERSEEKAGLVMNDQLFRIPMPKTAVAKPLWPWHVDTERATVHLCAIQIHRWFRSLDPVNMILWVKKGSFYVIFAL